MSRKSALMPLLALLLVACGKTDAPREAEPPAPASAQAAFAPETPPAPAPAPVARAGLSVEDIGRWERGVAAEKKAVQDAAAKLAAAKDDNTKLEALHAATEMRTVDEGARAAGLDSDGYRRIKTTFSSAVGQLSPLEMEMDVSQMPAEMIEQMKQSRAAGAERIQKELPPEVFQALKTRAVDLRKMNMDLVAERLKVANAAR